MSGYQIIVGLLVFFSAAAATAGPTYYVSNAGNDSADGLSPKTAWKTVNKVNSTVRTTSANVYFRAGDVWHDQQLRINWAGTATDPAIIDAYHLVDGRAVTGPGKLRKPEINGTFEATCRAAKNCQLHNSRAVPSSMWHGLVVVGADNVTVRNLRLRDSAGAGITFREGSSYRNILIENNDLAHWARGLIRANRVSQLVIRGNVADQGNYCHRDKYSQCPGPGWPAGIVVVDSKPAHALLENNTVTRNFGEGLSCLRSSHVIIRGNRAGNSRSSLYYLDNCNDSVVESNIAWADPTKRWHWTGKGQEGIAMAAEDYPKSSTTGNTVNNIIRNNLIAGLGACFRIGMDERSRAAGVKIGGKIYGNTCMGIQGFAFLNRLSDLNVERLIVSNNIFHSTNGSNGPCRNDATVVTMRSNLWNTKPDASCRGSGDVVGDPKVQGSGWATKSFDNPPRVADFQLRSGSVAQGRGVSLTASAANLAKMVAAPLVAVPCRRFDTTEMSLDFNCTVRPARPNLGALESGNLLVPQAPVLWF
jgi:hypothetical protein